MKKTKQLLFLLTALLFLSCTDDSGDFARIYHSDTDVRQALKVCLNLSFDTANVHLSVNDGFYTYQDAKYRVQLPASANHISDVLDSTGNGNMRDSLVLKMNRALEMNATRTKSHFSKAINDLTILEPKALLDSKKALAVDYFKTLKYVSLLESLRVDVQDNMDFNGATALWRDILRTYAEYDTQPVSIDLVQHVTQQMVTSLLLEMSLEEENIRRDTTHQKSDKLKEVFQYIK